MSRPHSTKVDEKGRICTKCSEYKPWSEFRKSASSTTGHTPSCKACLNPQRREWERRNPERHAAYVKKYRESGRYAAANRKHYYKDVEASRARARRYYLENLEAYRERGREYYRSLTPEQKATIFARAAWRKRYYLKLTRGVFTDAEWKKLLNRFSGLCAYCETAKAEHREHVIPISQGGSPNMQANVSRMQPI